MVRDSSAVNRTALLQLFQFEKELRHAGKVADLAYLLVNQLRTLVRFDSAVLFRIHRQEAKPVQASDVARPDPDAPMLRWQTDVVGHFLRPGVANKPLWLPLAEIETLDRRSYAEWGEQPVYWLPLITPDGRMLGGLWIRRDDEFRPDEQALLEKIAEVAAHAWAALERKQLQRIPLTRVRLIGGVIVAVVFLAMFIPVQLTVLAPAEVVAHDPAIVTAPLNGVIEAVDVTPNERVSEGTVLLHYDATEAEGRLAVANEELLVAQSELLSTQQAAFIDPREKAQLAVLRNRMALRQTERDYAQSVLNKIVLKSPRDGVAVFRDKADLEGSPVQTGQALLQIADPRDTELLIELPVADAITLEPESEVTLFLDRAPLKPVKATLRYSSYVPEITASGVLSYYLKARFTTDEPPILGLRGTARLEGGRVSLFFYLFRRPIAALRQSVGW